MKPLTSDVERQVEAVLEAFCTAYRADVGNCYYLELKPKTRNTLNNVITTRLGITMTDAKVDEILAEVTELHRLDGRIFEFEGEEYEPEDDGYKEVLQDHLDSQEQTITGHIQQLIHRERK